MRSNLQNELLAKKDSKAPPKLSFRLENNRSCLVENDSLTDIQDS